MHAYVHIRTLYVHAYNTHTHTHTFTHSHTKQDSYIQFVCGSDMTSECLGSEVRLANQFDSSAGLVEVCLHGRWGKVCDDLWGRSEAQVVCTQLGYPESDRTGESEVQWNLSMIDTWGVERERFHCAVPCPSHLEFLLCRRSLPLSRICIWVQPPRGLHLLPGQRGMRGD